MVKVFGDTKALRKIARQVGLPFCFGQDHSGSL